MNKIDKNKKKIILVVLIVAFFLVFMREADRYIARENSSSVNNTTTITDSKNTINDRNNQNITDNIVSKEDLEAKVKELNNDEDVIKMFIEFCKKGNVDNAYNMIHVRKHYLQLKRNFQKSTIIHIFPIKQLLK